MSPDAMHQWLRGEAQRRAKVALGYRDRGGKGHRWPPCSTPRQRERWVGAVLAVLYRNLGYQGVPSQTDPLAAGAAASPPSTSPVGEAHLIRCHQTPKSFLLKLVYGSCIKPRRLLGNLSAHGRASRSTCTF